MGNLIEIQSQIEKLQKQAAEIKAREFDKTVRQIMAMMAAFGITLKDLQRAQGSGGDKPGRAARKGRVAGKKTVGRKAAGKKKVQAQSDRKGSKVAAKYRGPNGETWSGRGSMPRWLAGLVEAGKSKESFAIKS